MLCSRTVVSSAIPGVTRPPVLAPCRGVDRHFERYARTLLSQDYPSFRLVFVARDMEDPASPVIAEAVGVHPGAQQILSGKASGCGQKNHNLLRGVAVLGHRPPILVFCDSTRIAPPHWLKALVAPVARGEAEVASGYHHGIPRDRRLPALGHAFTILGLYMTKGIPLFNQPWGGGTAIRRETFERLGVEGLWSRTVVDDVSLAALLKKHRIRTGLSPGAVMTTPLDGETLGAWLQWLVRQWFYLKVCLPGSWVAAGLTCYLFSGILILAAMGVIGAIPGWVTGVQALVCLTFLSLSASLALVMRTLHPEPGPPWGWLAAAFLAPTMAAWAHMRTLFSMEITWRNIRYRVTWKGVVEDSGMEK